MCASTSKSGAKEVRFRKGEKDTFLEVWSAKGMQSSLKITTKIAKVYNDVVFGGISWSCDEQKIVFIGEEPEIAEFKNSFDAPKD